MFNVLHYSGNGLTNYEGKVDCNESVFSYR